MAHKKPVPPPCRIANVHWRCYIPK